MESFSQSSMINSYIYISLVTNFVLFYFYQSSILVNYDFWFRIQITGIPTPIKLRDIGIFIWFCKTCGVVCSITVLLSAPTEKS